METLQPDDPGELGTYRMLRRLNAGGGRVYLARSPGGRTVAVKVVRPDLAADADFRGRFRHEVEIARAVSGRYTAPVVDADPGPASRVGPTPPASTTATHGRSPSPETA